MTPEAKDDSFDIASTARDLAGRVKDLVDRAASLAPTDAPAVSAIRGQLSSILEGTATVSALPVRQMQIIATAVQQQREILRTLQQQLQLFDDQLAVLETAMAPAVAMGKQWSNAQQTLARAARTLEGPRA